MMGLYLIIILLALMLYMIYELRSSVSSLTSSTKQLVELTDHSIMTRGALNPVFCQSELMKKCREWDEDNKELEKRGTFHGLDQADELLKQLGMGKSLHELIMEINIGYENLLKRNGSEATCKKMVMANLDVFHNRKTMEQAERETWEIERQYIYRGEKWEEFMKEKDDYIERVKVTHAGLNAGKGA